ncbi:MAG: M50 family metallopeptidase [Rikenellaceae bacterium]
MNTNNHIKIHLPIDLKWLNTAEEFVSLYASTVKFNPQLAEMIKYSVQEVCGELHERSEGIEHSGSYLLSINSTDEEIEVSVSYDGRIPLNPMKDKNYEVPVGSVDLDDFSTDTLWLHLIKCRMDRVFFSVDGSMQSLKMVKYQREQGKERQVWVMNLKPRLKSDLNIDINNDTESRGKFIGFVQDYKTASVLRLGEGEMHAIQKMDGQTSIYDIYMDAVDEGLFVAPQVYINLYEALESKDMLYKEEEKLSFTQRIKKMLEYLTFTIPNCDAIVGRVHSIVKFLFSPQGVALSIIVGLSAIYPIIIRYNSIAEDYNNAFDIIVNNWWIFPLFYIINTITVLIHELSHGVSCKHYGGKVPRIGLTFYLSSFIWFCDTTSSYNFKSKLARIMVSLAGPLSTLLLFGIFVWSYYFSVSEPFQLLWLALSIVTGLGLIMNFNPFIRMDSYYILSELLEVNNLREKTIGSLEQRVRKMLGLHYEKIEIPRDKRKLLNIYAVIGVAVTLFFFLLPFYRFAKYLLSDGDIYIKIVWGAFIALFAGYSLFSSISAKIKSIRHHTHKLK